MLFALPNLSSSDWSRTLLGSLAQWWSWGLVTPLVLWTDTRLPFKKNQLGMRILAHLLASVALTILYLYVFTAMRAFVGLGAWSVLADTRFLPTAFRQGLLGSWVVYWVIFGVQHTAHSRFRYISKTYQMEGIGHAEDVSGTAAFKLEGHDRTTARRISSGVRGPIVHSPPLLRPALSNLPDLGEGTEVSSKHFRAAL